MHLAILFQILHCLGQVQKGCLILLMAEQLPHFMVLQVKHRWTRLESIVNKANALKRCQVYIAVMLKSQPQNVHLKGQQMVLVVK